MYEGPSVRRERTLLLNGVRLPKQGCDGREGVWDLLGVRRPLRPLGVFVLQYAVRARDWRSGSSRTEEARVVCRAALDGGFFLAFDAGECGPYAATVGCP